LTRKHVSPSHPTAGNRCERRRDLHGFERRPIAFDHDQVVAGAGGAHVRELVEALIGGIQLDEDDYLALQALEAVDRVAQDRVGGASGAPDVEGNLPAPP
jgi:hypothetical protein